MSIDSSQVIAPHAIGLGVSCISCMNHAEQLGRLLADLGQTPDDVAATLNAQNVRGVRNTARFLNPIVRYAQTCLREEGVNFDVCEPGILRLVCPDGTRFNTPLPKPVAEFIDKFNQGEYSFLELDLP